MKKILVIPHHPGLSGIKIRLIELAKALSGNHKVYLLNWDSVQGDRSLLRRVASTLRDAFKRRKRYHLGDIEVIEFPVLHRPLFLAPFFNTFWLTGFIKEDNIDVVVNGSFYMFDLPKRRPYRYIFDVADLPVSDADTGFDRFISRRISSEINKADVVTVISRGLAEYVSANYRRESVPVPNGVGLKKMASVTALEIEELRRIHGLQGRWIVGYVGFLGEWVNVELIIDSFTRVAEQVKDATLLFIGHSPMLDEFRRRYGRDNIVFVGGVDNVEPYFRLIDVGVLPHKKCLFQDVAFHIKLIEYSAARKFVVSTSLMESVRLGFQNIIFAEEDVTQWAVALLKTRELTWRREWDSQVERYDWVAIAQSMEEFFS